MGDSVVDVTRISLMAYRAIKAWINITSEMNPRSQHLFKKTESLNIEFIRK